MANIIRVAGGSPGMVAAFSNSSDTHAVHFQCTGADIEKTYYIILTGPGDSNIYGIDDYGIKNGAGISDIKTIAKAAATDGSKNNIAYLVMSFTASASDFSGDITFGKFFTASKLYAIISEYHH